MLYIDDRGFEWDHYPSVNEVQEASGLEEPELIREWEVIFGALRKQIDE